MYKMGETSVRKQVVNTIDKATNDHLRLVQASTDTTRQSFDKAAFNRGLEKRKIVINDESWERIMLVSKLCYMRNEEADIYDVFDFIRTQMLGGWNYTARQLAKIDAEIEAEENGLRRTR